MPENYPEILTAIVFAGREYRFLLQAELALQNRTRALLSSWHAVAQSPKDRATLTIVAPPSACQAPDTAAAEDHGPDDTLDTDVPAAAAPVSQAEDHVSSVTLDKVVPAWLLRPPKGIPKATWQPRQYLQQSPAAQVLVGHALALVADRKARRRELERLVSWLPIWQDWAADIRGIDAYGLARVLAETGDLWQYPTVAKVWKRLGVGLWNGERQRQVKGVTEAKARAIGYSPRRRAVVYNLQTGLLTQNKAPDSTPGAYRLCYLARKLEEEVKAPDATKMVWHKRASRYMAKRFLKDLWVAWREVMPRPAGVEEAALVEV